MEGSGTAICRSFEFCYGHSLPEHKGKCKQIHGHNATLEVVICGPCPGMTESAGMIADFGELKKVVNDMCIVHLDHKMLNEVLPINYQPPTAENISKWVWDQLEAVFDKNLVAVKVYETPNCYAITCRVMK